MLRRPPGSVGARKNELALFFQFVGSVGSRTKQKDLTAHRTVKRFGRRLDKFELVAVPRSDFVDAMGVLNAVAATDVRRVELKRDVDVGSTLLIREHFRPNSIDVDVVRVIHLVRNVPAGRAHIRFQSPYVARLAVFSIFEQSKEFQMKEFRA